MSEAALSIRVSCAQAVTLHRFRYGKALTGSTLCQIGAQTSDLCTVCGLRDDVVHVLDECRKYERQRREWQSLVVLKDGGIGTLKERMNAPVWMLAQFIVDCGLNV